MKDDALKQMSVLADKFNWIELNWIEFEIILNLFTFCKSKYRLTPQDVEQIK
jgi:hypothetical protein